MNLHDLPTPALLLDLDVLEANLERMQHRANRLGVRLRPHVKTHKCVEVARLQHDLGAKGLTVSTLQEARVFIAAGFDDLTWAVPIAPAAIPDALQLARRATLRLLVDSLEAVAALEVAALRAGLRLHVWLKVDCGYHRAGVDPGSPYAEAVMRRLLDNPAFHFDGILTHAGHSYYATSQETIRPIAAQEREVLLEFAARMRAAGLPVPALSLGSTPTLSVAEDLHGIDEIRPGNYAFHDFTQVAIGSCRIDDCALTVLSSVISHQPGAGYFVTDAGALALSKDAGPTHLPGRAGMGQLFEDYRRRELWEGIRLEALSQEHGKVVADRPERIEGRFRVGEKVRILEHHSCLTAAQFDQYHVVRGEEVVDRWHIHRQR